MKVAIMTDSNSGIDQVKAKELGIKVIPMPLFINEELFLEDVTISQEQFYESLKKKVDVHTSQPSPGDVMEYWDELLKEYDQVVHIPMSSGLSSTTETAIMLSKDEAYEGKVFVVDNQRISITQKDSVFDAMDMASRGIDGATIKKVLEKTKLDSSIYIMVDTMEFLKKGGRVTAAAAGIATVLNIKPVLQIQGGKLDQYSKARGFKGAKKDMIKAIRKDLDGRFKNFLDAGEMQLDIAYTGSDAECEAFIQEILAAVPEIKDVINRDPLSLSVSCHIGPGALAVAACRRCNETMI